MVAEARRRLRLDQLLVERGLAESRTRAQALILAGRVKSGERLLDKPGERVDTCVDLEVDAGRRFVSRGAHKLRGALETFGVRTIDRDAMDVGASTGGFTQVLLDAGARRVLAVDVGRGQLDWGLRNDPRVLLYEGLNARYLETAELACSPALAVVDVSFISLERVLPPIVARLVPDRHGVDVLALIKPQFEVGRGRVGRGGIVRDPQLHRDVLVRLSDFARVAGWRVAGLCASPLLGAEGNREFFMHLRPGEPPRPATEDAPRIAELVQQGGAESC